MYGLWPDGGLKNRQRREAQIVTKLRQVDVLTSQGRPVAEAVRTIGVTEVTYYRWALGGLKEGRSGQAVNTLESENKHLRRARWSRL